jgi:hypothetical protein
MNTAEQIIMVQIADPEWTLEALHCACLQARNTSARILLVKMIPVQHLALLGTELGYMNFTYQDQVEFAAYQTTLEDYDVEFTPLVFQYEDLSEAIAQAAEHVNAEIVFAKLPESGIRVWTNFQRWSLNRRLAAQNCQWIQQPVYEVEASTVIKEALSELSGFAKSHSLASLWHR